MRLTGCSLARSRSTSLPSFRIFRAGNADGCGGSPHDSVKHDVGKLKASRFIEKGTEVLGYVFDVTHGTVEEVKTSSRE